MKDKIVVQVPSNKSLQKKTLKYSDFLNPVDHAKALVLESSDGSDSSSSRPDIRVKKSRRRKFVVTEKMDGVRAMWNGSELLARRGGDLKAPRSLVSGLPGGSETALVGELCATTGDPQKLKGLVSASPAAAQRTHERQKTHLVLFDDMASTNKSYIERMAALDEIARKNKSGRVKTVKILGEVDISPKPTTSSSSSSLSSSNKIIKKIINLAKKQDEGVILTQAMASPEETRFKVKNFKEGTATVLAASGLKTADGRTRRTMTVEGSIKINLKSRKSRKSCKSNQPNHDFRQQCQHFRVSFNVPNNAENRKRIFRGAQIRVLFRLQRDKKTRKIVKVVDCRMIAG